MHLIFTKCSGLRFFKPKSIIRHESLLNYRKLIMRTIVFSFFLTISGLLQASELSGQNLRNIPVNFSFKNTTLKDAFHKIEESTNIRFTYKSKEVAPFMNVNYNPKGQSLDIVLNELLLGTDLTFEQVNDVVVVVKKQSADKKENLLAETIIQQKAISGKVTDINGEALTGVSVRLKGSSTGTSTNLNGNYTLNLPAESGVLEFSYIGYETKDVSISSQSVYNVQLISSSESLSDVVVTALGVTKEKRSLVYSSAEVKGSDFTEARENNIANALTGKIAGVNATQVASGPGGSSRVVIRGNGSLNANQQPLYVVNGLPIDNSNRGAKTNTSGFNADRGDGISSINPDDIESITVLKSGAAAALYGSQAANGVILITTKKGRAQSGVGVEFNSNLSIGTPASYPHFQYEYGSGNDGVKPATQAAALSAGRLSYGGKIDGSPVVQFDGVVRPYSAVKVKDNVNNFYRPSSDLTNSLAFTGGSEAFNFRLSVSDLRSEAQTPNSSFKRKTGNLSVQSNLGPNNLIVLESTIQYNVENGKNRPTVGYAEINPSWATYLIGNTVDIRSLAPGYNENGNEIQWNPVPAAPNPWFVVNKMGNKDDRERFIGMASAKVNVLENLFIKGSVARDFQNIDEMNFTPIGTAFTPKGYLFTGQEQITKTNYQALMNYHTEFMVDFGLNAMVGANKEQNLFKNNAVGGQDFIIPDFISYTNLAKLNNPSKGQIEWGTNSIFGSADFNYKGFANLSVTGRKDWFSTLNPGSNSIFYPSIGGSLIMSDFISMPSNLSFLKLRANWAQVGGSTIDPGAVLRTYTIRTGGFNGIPVQDAPNNLLDPTIKPLTVTTSEGGFEMQFYNNRLGFDATYYSRVTTNDMLAPSISQTSGFTSGNINAGKITNKGVELLITGNPIRKDNFRWDVSYNLAYNQSKIIELAPGLDNIVVGTGISSAVRIINAVGLPYGTVRGWKMEKNADGVQVYNKTSGYENRVEGDFGVANPPYTMGLSNDFRYKNFSLNVLMDAKFGAVAFNNMWVYAMRFGLTKNTLPGREEGLTVTGVDQTGAPFTKLWPVDQLDTYYNNRGANYSELQTFNTDFVKLRSLILNYNLPVAKWGLKNIQGISVGLVARNLLILYQDKEVKAAGLDPEMQQTVGNATGTAGAGEPRTRNIGFNLSVRF